ncbi:Kinesin-like protein like protein [Aduncisulcus paluster]|uniref:Kinesin-like protein like protein n=1 Tax=Aduncisulcus paluster TaxID=2918883 RepID=A0ABQ5KVJ8_9EUKA|nr:Kinesin-like protein like protein [Aduncisulcus paluster]
MRKERNIKVAVRFRPLNSREIQHAIDRDEIPGKSAVTCHVDKKTVDFTTTKSDFEKRRFVFDRVFGASSKQVDVYNFTAKPVVNDVLNGYNGTIFAYGQTGTGKTYTMGIVDKVPERKDGKRGGKQPKMYAHVLPNASGLVSRSLAHIFAALNDRVAKRRGFSFAVTLSFIQIYKDTAYDLLNPGAGPLPLHEMRQKGFVVGGATTVRLENLSQAVSVVNVGLKNRAVAPTLMNATSSRSHTLLTISVRQEGGKPLDDSYTHPIDSSSYMASPPLSLLSGAHSPGPVEDGVIMEGGVRAIEAKLVLVDLAGSERVKKSKSNGQRLEEARCINQSLSALGNVINALIIKGSTHVPYRDSKLTKILMDSLGGNSNVVLIATVSPAPISETETLSTLQFAQRCKLVTTKAIRNEERDPSNILRQLQRKIAKQREEKDKSLKEQREMFLGILHMCKKEMGDTPSSKWFGLIDKVCTASGIPDKDIDAAPLPALYAKKRRLEGDKGWKLGGNSTVQYSTVYKRDSTTMGKIRPVVSSRHHHPHDGDEEDIIPTGMMRNPESKQVGVSSYPGSDPTPRKNEVYPYSGDALSGGVHPNIASLSVSSLAPDSLSSLYSLLFSLNMSLSSVNMQRFKDKQRTSIHGQGSNPETKGEISDIHGSATDKPMIPHQPRDLQISDPMSYFRNVSINIIEKEFIECHSQSNGSGGGISKMCKQVVPIPSYNGSKNGDTTTDDIDTPPVSGNPLSFTPTPTLTSKFIPSPRDIHGLRTDATGSNPSTSIKSPKDVTPSAITDRSHPSSNPVTLTTDGRSTRGKGDEAGHVTSHNRTEIGQELKDRLEEMFSDFDHSSVGEGDELSLDNAYSLLPNAKSDVDFTISMYLDAEKKQRRRERLLQKLEERKMTTRQQRKDIHGKFDDSSIDFEEEESSPSEDEEEIIRYGLRFPPLSAFSEKEEIIPVLESILQNSIKQVKKIDQDVSMKNSLLKKLYVQSVLGKAEALAREEDLKVWAAVLKEVLQEQQQTHGSSHGSVDKTDGKVEKEDSALSLSEEDSDSIFE